MKTHVRRSHLASLPISRHERAFALVATITLLVLVALVCLGLLSLSSLSLRGGQQAEAQARAQANARMALMLAIGQIQKQTGPDQRVTATANILDTSPDTPQADGVVSPEWVGVWPTTTTGLLTDPPLITRGTGTELTLKDARDGTRRPHLAYLVSGSVPDPLAQRPAEAVTLVSANNQPNREVWAPLVRVNPDQVNGSNVGLPGKYGYWVKDASESVPLARYDKTGTAQPSATDPINGGYAKLLSPASESASGVPGLSALPKSSDIKFQKVYTSDSAALAATDVKAVRDALETNAFHSVGAPGYGVLADTLRGGLRSNLSPYLNVSGTNPSSGTTLASDTTGAGISDTDSIIKFAGLDRFAPKFGLLRDYWQLSNNIAGSFTNPEVNVQLPQMRSDRFGPERQSRTRQQLTPVVTEYSVYFDVTYHQASATDRRLNLMVFPRITLYNPYNVKLKGNLYHVQITNRINFAFTVPVKVRNAPTVKVDQTFTYDNYWAGDDNQYDYGGRARDLCFYLEAIDLEPGEAVVFTPSASQGISVQGGKAAQLNFPNTGNLNRNVLSANVPIDDNTCFYYPFAQFSNDPTTGIDLWDASNPTYKIKRYYDNGFHFGYDMSLGMRLRTLANNTTNKPSTLTSVKNNWSVVQVLDSDNWFRGNNGRWRDNTDTNILYTRSDFIANLIKPNPRTQIGMRLKWFKETNSNLVQNPTRNWNAAPLTNYDIRSPYSHRNPWDNIFPVANPNEFTYGQYAIDTYALAWNDPQNLPTLVGGKNRISPFFNSLNYEGNTFPLFDLPHKELPPLGIGQLRHAQLSSFSFWPSFIVGESYASPSMDRRYTAWPASTLGSAWQLAAQQYNGQCYWWEKGTSGTKLAPQDFNCVFDVTYEMNHALWDSYFLTGLKGDESGWNGTKWDASKPMPNPRMVANPFDATTNEKDWMLGLRRSARSLMIESPFNVNSANEGAWAGFLKSFRGIEIPTRGGAGSMSADQQAFARVLVPEAAGNTNISAQSADNWKAFQLLSDSKIDLLAKSLVKEVKRRGPFISVADFVNRRLVAGFDNPGSETDKSKTGLSGALQTALDDTSVEINNFITGNSGEFAMPQDIRPSVYPLVTDGGAQETRGYGPHNPAGKGAFSAGYVSQGDILAKVGHTLTARGDTFTIRAYGEALNGSGTQVLARAWCEATVQRLPEYLQKSADLPEIAPVDLTSALNRTFGRRYALVSFRWLHPEEI